MTTGYVPQNPLVLAEIFAWFAAELIVGFAISRLSSVRWGRICAWGLVFSAVGGVERIAATEPAGVRMLAIIGALLLGMKVLVSIEETAAGRTRLRPRNWFLFALGWPGMRPSTFADVPNSSKRHWAQLIRQGFQHLAAGSVLVLSAWWLSTASSGHLSTWYRLANVTVLLLPGLSLIMHFGLFNILAGFWRRMGADTQALFRAPLQSTSLAEFWGRRWNLAFSEMTALIVFRPLQGRIGTRTATIAAFLFSGLLHELAISVPVQAGYGLPFLYFILHAAAMQMEIVFAARGRAVNRVRWRGRLWTLAWLLVPLPILFHRPFLEGCVWPLIGLSG